MGTLLRTLGFIGFLFRTLGLVRSKLEGMGNCDIPTPKNYKIDPAYFMLLFCLILCCNEPFSAKSAIAGFAGAQYEENKRFRCGASPIEPWGQLALFLDSRVSLELFLEP